MVVLRVARLLRAEYAKYFEILCQICQLIMKICPISGYNMPNSGALSSWTSLSIPLQTTIAKTLRQGLYIYFIRPLTLSEEHRAAMDCTVYINGGGSPGSSRFGARYL